MAFILIIRNLLGLLEDPTIGRGVSPFAQLVQSGPTYLPLFLQPTRVLVVIVIVSDRSISDIEIKTEQRIFECLENFLPVVGEHLESQY